MSATAVETGPFVGEWTRPSPRATAAELAIALAAHDLGDLGPWHRDLAASVNELHRVRICTESDPNVDALDGAWGVGDPIVALVRAVALLARRRTDARSATARLLVDVLGSASDGQASWAS